jgi:hypothetical protein
MGRTISSPIKEAIGFLAGRDLSKSYNDQRAFLIMRRSISFYKDMRAMCYHLAHPFIESGLYSI